MTESPKDFADTGLYQATRTLPIHVSAFSGPYSRGLHYCSSTEHHKPAEYGPQTQFLWLTRQFWKIALVADI